MDNTTSLLMKIQVTIALVFIIHVNDQVMSLEPNPLLDQPAQLLVLVLLVKLQLVLKLLDLAQVQLRLDKLGKLNL
jgi:hypothetical protein